MALAAGPVLVVGVLIVLARRAGNVPTLGHLAVIESYTWMAAKGQLLYGPYSRFQWHHPGPLAFFWLAPFYALAGWKSAGMSAGALTLNLAVLAVTFSVVFRRADRVAAVAISGAIAIYAWRAAPILTSAWNPHIPVFPLIALIVVAADVVSGAVMSLPAVAVLASLIAQTHIALLPSVLVVGAFSVIGVVAARSQTAEKKRALIVTAAVLLVLWALPLVEQVTAHPGNITQIWTFFVSEPHPGQRFANALYAWEDMLTGLVRPTFAVAQGLRVRQRSLPWVEGFTMLEMMGVLAAVVLAVKARRRFEAALGGLLLLVSLLALWSATRIEETIFDHEVFWMSSLGALNIALLVAPGVRPFAARTLTARVTAAVCGAGFAACLAIGIHEMRAALLNASTPNQATDAVSAVADNLRVYFDRERIVRPVVRIDQDAWPLAAGVILRLQKKGVPVAVEDDWLPMFTPFFAATGQESVALTVMGKPEHVRNVGKPGDVVVIESDPLLFVHRLVR